mgnify:CR=1 FL=1
MGLSQEPSRGSSLLQLLGWGYLLGLFAWFGLRLLFFDGVWWLALLNTLAFYLFAPLVIVLPLALWQRHRRLMLAALLAGALFVSLFHPLLLPFAKASRPSRTSPTLTVMSFNALWRNHDYEQIARAIVAADPDVIGFQEVQEENVLAIQALLAPHYPYQADPPGDTSHTVWVLSRLPLEDVTVLDNPPLQRGLQVTVRHQQQTVDIVVTHLAPNNMPLWPVREFIATTTQRYELRAAEVRYLLAHAQARTAPLLILCDCNMTDSSETYALLRSQFEDSFQQRGWGFGHTLYVKNIPFAVQRVDYVWHTPDIELVDAFVGRPGNSDHLPMIARFVWPGATIE